MNFNIAFEGCEHDDAGFGELRPDGDYRIDATHVGQSEVPEGFVGPVLPKLLDGLAASGCLGHQLHVRLTISDGRNPLL